MSILKSRDLDNEDNWNPIPLNTPSQLYVGATEPLDPNVKIWVDTSKNSQTYADYVIEQGTDGIWTYRKWNSGIAECWGEKIFDQINTSAVGSIYVASTPIVPLPTGLFIDRPIVIAECSPHGDYYCGLLGAQNTTTNESQIGSYVIWRPNSGLIYSPKFNFIIKGRWK